MTRTRAIDRLAFDAVDLRVVVDQLRATVDQQGAALEQLRTAHLDAVGRIARLETERDRRRSRIDGDATFLAQLLPPIGAVFGSDPFTIGELKAHPNAGLRLVIDGRSSTAIGQLFARYDGRPVAEYVVVRAGHFGTRSLWKVQVVQVPLHKSVVRSSDGA